MSNKLLVYVGVQACRSLIYLNTHSSIRARSTFTSFLFLPLFIFSSSSSFVPFLSVLLALSCCPCHYLSCSVITRSCHSTYLCTTVVVKMEALTSEPVVGVHLVWPRLFHAFSRSCFSRAKLCVRFICWRTSAGLVHHYSAFHFPTSAGHNQ